MVDLHCHILPGVDDGARDMEQALAMARIAVAGGTEAIVTTPHCGLPGQKGNFWGQNMRSQFLALRQAIDAAGIPLELFPGMEFFGGEDLGELYEMGKLLPLSGSRYLLVEFYFDENADYMERVLEQAVFAGLTPVIAHPERYSAVQRNPQWVENWFRKGYIIQSNKGSILGDLEPRAEETVWDLLEHGLVHVVGSDAHSHRHRTPDLSRVRWQLTEAFGREYAALLLEENPRRIVTNRRVVRETLD